MTLYKNMMLEVKRLERARALLAKPNGWTRGEYARDKHGNPTRVRAERAASFCVLGACDRTEARASYLHDALSEKNRHIGLADWNDHPRRTQKQVVAMFDKAITLLRKRAESYK